MARAKYQVLVIPYHVEEDTVQYCTFRRSDTDVWQFIAGGGEEEDGDLLASARREAWEEANIPMELTYVQLDSQCSIPTKHFKNALRLWGTECLVIPEYSFAVKLDHTELTISHEHTQYEWVEYQVAAERLEYDSNKTALWELDQRIKLGLMK